MAFASSKIRKKIIKSVHSEGDLRFTDAKGRSLR